MPAKLLLISASDRATGRVLARSEAEGEAELIACTNAMQDSLKCLAAAYPGSVAFGAIIGGTACGVTVICPSSSGDLSSRIAPERARFWGQFLASFMDPELRAAFEAAYRAEIETKEER